MYARYRYTMDSGSTLICRAVHSCLLYKVVLLRHMPFALCPAKNEENSARLFLFLYGGSDGNSDPKRSSELAQSACAVCLSVVS